MGAAPLSIVLLSLTGNKRQCSRRIVASFLTLNPPAPCSRRFCFESLRTDEILRTVPATRLIFNSIVESTNFLRLSRGLALLLESTRLLPSTSGSVSSVLKNSQKLLWRKKKQ